MGCQQNVRVIRHQDISMNLAIMSFACDAQQVQVSPVVGIILKTGLAIVPALDQVLRKAGNVQSPGSRHTSNSSVE
jgi:hypothetical protein